MPVVGVGLDLYMRRIGSLHAPKRRSCGGRGGVGALHGLIHFISLVPRSPTSNLHGRGSVDLVD
jgi:hypothetical protein